MAIDVFASRLLQQFDSILFCLGGIKIDDGDGLDKITVMLFYL